MVKLSRYAHTFELDGAVAMYHSLRMKPVYLNRESYENLRECLASSFFNTLDDAPETLKNEINELVKYKILTKTDDEDDKVLAFVKSKIPKPTINVCYMILSEQCNLACKYCFLGNNSEEKRSQFVLESMTKETADKAIDFFVRQLKLSGLDFEDNKPVIIFYGGEPLVNYEVLVYIATKINELRDVESCLKYAELSMVTNGLLLNDERILKLKELGVAIGISVDGFNEESNKNRVDLAGNIVYERILKTLDRCKKLDAKASLSVTLSEETIKNKGDILELIDNYGVRSFGFNIMMSSENFVLPESYNIAAAQFILDEFVELRKRGIYEERIMRKLKALTETQE